MQMKKASYKNSDIDEDILMQQPECFEKYKEQGNQ